MSTIPTALEVEYSSVTVSDPTRPELLAPDGGTRELIARFLAPSDELGGTVTLVEDVHLPDGTRRWLEGDSTVSASPIELMMAAAASLGVDVDEVADRLTDDPDSTPADLVIALSWEIWRSPAIRAIGVSASEAVEA